MSVMNDMNDAEYALKVRPPEHLAQVQHIELSCQHCRGSVS